ncbi:hypothetical protein E2C01_049025 [Portunus trituberculatus]|uniref:Uncharacterized protein n=1 Tax=Portunus trituberculatus TaxID=210409 RepID=A0A5B7G841_PORTR|nr:hypothetical protein [Portunus trituberculatus]
MSLHPTLHFIQHPPSPPPHAFLIDSLHPPSCDPSTHPSLDPIAVILLVIQSPVSSNSLPTSRCRNRRDVPARGTTHPPSTSRPAFAPAICNNTAIQKTYKREILPKQTPIKRDTEAAAAAAARRVRERLGSLCHRNDPADSGCVFVIAERRGPAGPLPPKQLGESFAKGPGRGRDAANRSLINLNPRGGTDLPSTVATLLR